MTFTLCTVMIGALLAGTDEPHALSTASNRVEIVLYSDFQCPYCAQIAPAIREIQTKGIDGAEATIQFKNYPLSIHANAQLPHQAAMAAKEQGKFWEMH